MSDQSKSVARSQDAPPDAATAATAVVKKRLRNGACAALRDVRCESSGGAYILSGYVSSFYFKQLAQEILRKADGACKIINELEVEDRSSLPASGHGASHVHSTEKQGSTETNHGCADIDSGRPPHGA